MPRLKDVLITYNIIIDRLAQKEAEITYILDAIIGDIVGSIYEWHKTAQCGLA